MDIERLFGTNRSCFEKTLLDEAILKQTYLSSTYFFIIVKRKTKKDNLFNYLVKENIALHPQIPNWEIKDFKAYEKELLGNSASFYN
jgi:hypothetical protein